MLVPILIGVGSVVCYKLWQKKTGQMNPERQQIYEQALVSLADPVSLRNLADAFQKEGLTEQADMLRKRAALREMPEDVKEGRRRALAKGLKSEDKVGVATLADAFEKEGAVGAAQRLRDYLAGLV